MAKDIFDKDFLGFGRELEGKVEFGITLDDFKDLMLYHLEDYLFQTKFNEKVTNVSIPALGIDFTTEQRYALDLRGYFDIPQFSFDEKGIIYSNGQEGAYVSPEFFAKCFIERVIDVWTSISKLYLPKRLMENKKLDGEKRVEKSSRNELAHVDFVDAYNKLVDLKRLNNDLTHGLIGLIPDYRDINRILNLRKIEIAAQIQTDIEMALAEISQEQYEEQAYDFDNAAFWESEEFAALKKEHSRLFRSGPFEAPLEQHEWQMNDWNYDEGTDEERKDWQQKYKKLKKEFEERGLLEIKEGISSKVFPLSKLQNRVIDYLKTKIYRFDYQMNLGAPGNPFINELGLDVTACYGHPADKYIPERLNRRLSSYDLEDASAEDYDVLYGISSDGYYDEFDEEYTTRRS